MSYTKKSAEEFVASTFEWGVFVNGVHVYHNGVNKAPDALDTEWPNQMVAKTHSADFHAPNDSSLSKVARLKRAMTLANLRAQASSKDHTISMSIRCTNFRYPVLTRPKGATKVCCVELDINIPGHTNTSESLSHYLLIQSHLLETLPSLSIARILLRMHKDQPLTDWDPTLTHTTYLERTFLSLGALIPSIRSLTLVLILTRGAEHRRIEVSGSRVSSSSPWAMTWKDTSAAERDVPFVVEHYPVEAVPGEAPFSNGRAAMRQSAVVKAKAAAPGRMGSGAGRMGRKVSTAAKRVSAVSSPRTRSSVVKKGAFWVRRDDKYRGMPLLERMLMQQRERERKERERMVLLELGSADRDYDDVGSVMGGPGPEVWEEV